MTAMKKLFRVATTAILISPTSCTQLSSERAYKMIGNSPAVVQAAFNGDVGKVRVLMLVSPTCGVCLRGASEASEQLVKLEHGKDTRVYVVWVPRLNALEKNVTAATRVVAAPWAQQYWDGNDLLGQQYKQVLGWNDDAWDVYFLYGPKAQWKGNLPPAPDFFMHQTEEKGPRLDAHAFGSKVDELLKQR
jgi:hypothetical protein